MFPKVVQEYVFEIFSDSEGTRFIIHEVTDSTGNIIHRDFDAVRIPSGQLILKE